MCTFSYIKACASLRRVCKRISLGTSLGLGAGIQFDIDARNQRNNTSGGPAGTKMASTRRVRYCFVYGQIHNVDSI